jgi:L-threonylcarbamoyladenylate synthase
VSELVRIAEDGEDAAREALEACVGAGGVAIFPADGLYGLACDPMSAGAVRRIHELKGRPARKPSAVLYFTPLVMRELVGSMGEKTRAAAAALLPGPVTLVIANPERRYPLACREDPERLGVRLIEGPLSGMPLPVFQTSANASGYTAPDSFDGIDAGIVEAADLAIDGGGLGGSPSTVVDVAGIDSGEGWRILRDGAMAADEIERRLEAPERKR